MLSRRRPPNPPIPNPRIDFHQWLSVEQTEALIRAGLASFGCVMPEDATVQWSAPSRRNPANGACDEHNPGLIIDITMTPETADQFRQPHYPAKPAPVVDGPDYDEEED